MEDCQSIIEEIYNVVKGDNKGDVASYIPELSTIDVNKFGVCLRTTEGKQFAYGDFKTSFSIQSIAKVLSLSLAYSILGEQIFRRVGVEPSGAAFNSLSQLETENGIPRNPLINSGAIVICDILCSALKNPKRELLEFIRSIANSKTIAYCPKIATSEKETGFRNYALINYLKSFGNIENDVDTVIELYFHLCSIKMNCVELSIAFGYLSNKGIQATTDKRILPESGTKRINAIMNLCGFYDEAGEFAYKVGLPGKSGVGGGIAAILPENYSVAIWSPKLNEKGNSYRGMKFLELFTSETQDTIF
ncbi:glutaminase [Flavivirga jejuensis]|uniref:Glutaminase n=1 Tax=Flavivirga jejuensis TaxID=870487 RepID=A0ABT8WKZ5_9FLAO|nr:glutaminase [Flavivirga jejuensis]MDO5973631.1 glutaminase [Flavivirga jejuensis]